jgi:L-fuconolactonase
MVTTNPQHNQSVIELADRHPGLTIIVDHLAHPDIHSGEWEVWARQIRQLSERPQVFLKLSGLATVSASDWDSSHWQPYVDHALECFGPARMMLGSDWPVSLLGGDFGRVWQAQLDTLAALSPDELHQLRAQTARTASRLG